MLTTAVLVAIGAYLARAHRRGESPWKMLFSPENVLLPLKINGYSRSEAARRVRAALDRVGLLGKEKLHPITLSGGEQQRLAIARAIVHRPSILIADEPTGNVDAASASELGALFKSFNQAGVTVIIATHDESFALPLKPRLIRLSQGVVAAELEA